MELPPQPMQETEQSASFGFDNRFHYQLPGPIPNRNHDCFLVHVQPDILDTATRHAGTSSRENLVLQPGHFPQGKVSSFRNLAARNSASYPGRGRISAD